MITLYDINFEKFNQIRNKLIYNAEQVREDYQKMTGRWPSYNIPRINDYSTVRFKEMIDTGVINESNFREHWFAETIMTIWNTEFYGHKFEALYKQYKKISTDPKYIKINVKIYEKASLWGFVGRDAREAAHNNCFLPFLTYRVAYEDTKGPWRHWFDSFCHDNKFTVGSIVEMRSRATHNHLWQDKKVYQSTFRLRTVTNHLWNQIKHKVFIILAYDQKIPPVTYSYKPSMGSHKMVTLLPIGESEIYYVSEQFLKISRKKAIKDAKGKKK